MSKSAKKTRPDTPPAIPSVLTGEAVAPPSSPAPREIEAWTATEGLSPVENSAESELWTPAALAREMGVLPADVLCMASLHGMQWRQVRGVDVLGAADRSALMAMGKEKISAEGAATRRMAAPTPQPVSERDLARELGVLRARVRHFRRVKLHPGADFTMTPGGVIYTAAGAAAVRTALGPHTAEPAAAEPQPAKAPPIAAPDHPGSLRVVEVPKNRKLLVAAPEAIKPGEVRADDRILVRVADNDLFLAGMVLPADRLIHLEGRSWQLRGRMPRRKGRWT